MNAEELKMHLKGGRTMERVDPGARTIGLEEVDDPISDVLSILEGTWTSPAQGWNLIALPFRSPNAPQRYRVLMNQYAEDLRFFFADKKVPNRGVEPDADGITDQLIDALDYQQVVQQVASADFPESDLRAENGRGIHHEPGLFLSILNHRSEHEGKALSLARLATIPHGDSVLAMGFKEVIHGPPVIPDANALPIRVNQDINSGYLTPYRHFQDNKFFGTVPTTAAGFPGFFPLNANAILQAVVPTDRVKKTTILHFDTKFGTGGIKNIPFVVREADATEMTATFWIMEVAPENPAMPTEFIMQYSQTVMLDFFDAPGGAPGERIRWPHISINTLRRT